ncbi:hypothetical protein VTI74DRAFT_2608 [Chaetomium olivicolor]
MPNLDLRPESGIRGTTSRMPRALLNVAAMVAIIAPLRKFFTWLAADDSYLFWFLCLFTWRYLRFVLNLVAFWLYSPASIPQGTPTYSPSRDVTAIIPTVDPHRGGFSECVRSCAENKPAKIIIVTAGDELYAQALCRVRKFERKYRSVEFVVARTQVASKREQVAMAVPHIETSIAVLLDDHVFWGPRFLESVLCAFEDPRVGLVGTNKRVRRKEGQNIWGRIWNMLGATYLCRHNFEIRATNAVDGGVFVVSGRTCAIRTEILRHPEFLPGYTNERFFFGLFGPLNPDDDNYNTRFVVRHGWKIKIQYTEDSVMETTLGVEGPLHTKFLGQCRRWARTTWRSNVCSLVTDRTVWSSQPYCVYAVYLTSLTNFALPTDSALLYLFVRSSLYSRNTLAGLVCWIFFTKTVKVFDYFRRHPQDIVLFPAYVAFAYFHSFIKLWTLLTFWDCTWSGRHLEQIKVNGLPPSQASTASSSSCSSLLKAKHQHHHQDHTLLPVVPRTANRNHPHIPALRALRARIADLHEQHMQHIASYQIPLLSELQFLCEGFAALQREQHAMCDNQCAIRAELQKVVFQADAVAKEQKKTVAGEGDLVLPMAGMKTVFRGAEDGWKTFVLNMSGLGAERVAVAA